MNVLLGVGGSELSLAALEETIERAREAGDDLTVAVFGSEEVGGDLDQVEQTVRDRLAEADFEADVFRIAEDDPAGVLVEIADREDYDRIVLGSGERSTLGKIQLGSVAEFVLLNAQTPVTLVR